MERRLQMLLTITTTDTSLAQTTFDQDISIAKRQSYFQSTYFQRQLLTCTEAFLLTRCLLSFSFTDEARSTGSSVLVHCLAGVSRSVTVTLAYLIASRSLCLNDAFSLVRARKPDVSPNFHFMEQLHSFERQLKENNNNNSYISSIGALLRTPSSSSSSSSTFPSPLASIVGHQLMGRNGKSLRASKYSCACIEFECKCMQTTTIGVSPDSGIEFDRWTPADVDTPK